MSSRFLTADAIHDGRKFLPAGSVLKISEDGTVIAVHRSAPDAGIERFNGILTPGFVNAHCHLELSHMRGVIPRGTGLIPFLQAVMRQRGGFSDEQKQHARHQAAQELHTNGVVAVGDIANTTDTIDLRAPGSLHFHTFVECIGFTDTAATARLAASMEVLNAFKLRQAGDTIGRQSIVPHAPYSVSPALFRLVNGASEEGLMSIHNQESAAEGEYFRNKTGPVMDLLGGLGIDDSFFEPTGKSSLQSYLPLISERHPIILVHNTFSSADDLAFARAGGRQTFWCLCPGANLYIEGRLPDLAMLRAAAADICIGTDSLASNTQLSVFAELLLLKEAFEETSWEELLCWACFNGARALQMEDMLGAFLPGRKPGVVLISSLDENARIARIV